MSVNYYFFSEIFKNYEIPFERSLEYYYTEAWRSIEYVINQVLMY